MAELEIVGLHWLLAKTNGYYFMSGEVEICNCMVDYFVILVQLCWDLGGRIMVFGSLSQWNLQVGVIFSAVTDYVVEVLLVVLFVLEDL